MSGKLATRLREGTKQSHSLAENADFIQCFLKGVVEKTSYRQLLGNFYFVYTALEEQLTQHQNHPLLSQLYFPELYRQQSLATDLSYYWGPQWQTAITPSDATQRYVDRINDIAIADPILLVAHSYTRYLGDLSGGQLLKKLAQRGMSLPQGQGIAFYEFDDIQTPKTFKATYRQSLDSLHLDEATITRIVDEANLAFKLNMELFKEVEGNLIQAIGQMIFSHLTRSRRNRQTPWSTELGDPTALQPQD
ncbi:biliverdin-producing heme oxygenase [Acaryochloris marina]|uniref:heme oxygenase (biliverdin-producing) n=1 Tax=Acaryochloris marina (strain MBIC 11017) TaxID=329726 RepID=B0BYL0_ACAM1|nr:heme oxygenase (biliverdin-producing) [Acaryochloris marina]ABW25895.1 heme oxygenase [Acaryochloris marina MBIC11017]BDM80753.1 heme oxygenase [Acaryochloris marina MBIC10699]